MDPVLNLGSKTLEVGCWRLGQGWAPAWPPTGRASANVGGVVAGPPDPAPHPRKGKTSADRGHGSIARRYCGSVFPCFWRRFDRGLFGNACGFGDLVQPRPKLGRWAAELDRRGRIHSRAVVELSGRGYDGGYDAVRRYSMRWSKERAQSTAVLTCFSANAPAGGLLGGRGVLVTPWSHKATGRDKRLQSLYKLFVLLLFWRARRDSNSRPSDSKSGAVAI
jgi:hypothetical protein